jgi:hypothetical protein
MDWADTIVALPNRVVMTMPIKVKELREVLTRIFEDSASE